MVDHHTANLLARREILDAFIVVLEHPAALVEVCGRVSDDRLALVAIAEAFDISEVAADAVLRMQVRRFTPGAIAGIRAELAEVERSIAEHDSAMN